MLWKEFYLSDLLSKKNLVAFISSLPLLLLSMRQKRMGIDRRPIPFLQPLACSSGEQQTKPKDGMVRADDEGQNDSAIWLPSVNTTKADCLQYEVDFMCGTFQVCIAYGATQRCKLIAYEASYKAGCRFAHQQGQLLEHSLSPNHHLYA